MKPRPPAAPYDLDRTDTLPVLALDSEDTGTLAMPQLLQREHARRAPDTDEPFTATDTFTVAALGTPMPAIPVSAPDLAEGLRERDGHLAEAARRERELEAQLVQAGRRVHELDEHLEQADRRCTELETKLALLAQRCDELEQEAAIQLEAVPGGAASSPMTAAPGLLDDLGTLRRTNGLLYESISSLHVRLGLHEAMLAEAEQALRGSEAVAKPEPVGNPVHAEHESPPAELADAVMAVDWPARYAELEMMLEGERAAAAARFGEQASRLARLQEELEAAAGGMFAAGLATLAASAPASLPDSDTATRVLVCLENGAESTLGRHTTIGRTPDNDIQINTTYVSRHHAVLLAGPGECIVEDLNSTNGILVNGHRVGRQILQHGDMLVVGKTVFRYELRP